MRFCMVTTFYPPYHFGGDATYVRALARALVARGHEVEVIHCGDAYRLLAPEPAERQDGDERITVHRLESRFGALSPLLTQQSGHPALKARKLRRLLGRGFDVVHFHNISLVGGPAVLAMSAAPVTLWTPHEHWLLCATHVFWKDRNRGCDRPTCVCCCLHSRVPPQLWRYTGLVRRSVRTVDLLLSPSAYTAERHREAGLEAPLAVLPLFSALAPPEDTEAVAENGVFLCVGRVVASKGIAELADAFATLPQLVLLVAGDGPQQAEIERRFGRAANIRFLGRVPQHELVPLYRSATALILPPLAPESFGLSVVEAFACGRPAIVRTAGGAPELIETTGGGIVYRDQDELRAALRQLSGDAGARATLARRARAAFCGTMPRRSTSTAISRVATPFARAKGWHQGAMRAILTFHSIDRFRLGSVLSAPAVRPSAGASRAPRRAGGRPRLAARPEDP